MGGTESQQSKLTEYVNEKGQRMMRRCHDDEEGALEDNAKGHVEIDHNFNAYFEVVSSAQGTMKERYRQTHEGDIVRKSRKMATKLKSRDAVSALKEMEANWMKEKGAQIFGEMMQRDLQRGPNEKKKHDYFRPYVDAALVHGRHLEPGTFADMNNTWRKHQKSRLLSQALWEETQKKRLKAAKAEENKSTMNPHMKAFRSRMKYDPSAAKKEHPTKSRFPKLKKINPGRIELGSNYGQFMRGGVENMHYLKKQKGAATREAHMRAMAESELVSVNGVRAYSKKIPMNFNVPALFGSSKGCNTPKMTLRKRLERGAHSSSCPAIVRTSSKSDDILPSLTQASQFDRTVTAAMTQQRARNDHKNVEGILDNIHSLHVRSRRSL